MKVTLQKSKIETYILFILLYVGIVIDNVVGYQMRTTGDDSALSKLYRLLILGYLLMIILFSNVKKSSKFIILLVYGLSLPLLQTLSKGNFEGVFTDILHVTKILFPILMIGAGTALYRRFKIETEDIDKYLTIISWIYPLSVLIPYVLRIGFRTYSGTSGYSGFYASGNELSIILSVMFIIHMDSFYKKRSIKSLVGLTISAFAVILTGTKAGIIVIALTIGYYLLKRDKATIKKIAFWFMGIIAVVVVGLLIATLLEDELAASMALFKYKFKQLDSNIINFMFSNRNTKIFPNFLLMLENPIEILVGAGYYEKVIQMREFARLSSRGLVEMDFFDIMFQYGIPMAVIVWAFYLRILLLCRRAGRNQYSFGIFCMLIYSFMAGHTLYTSSTGIILALLCLGAMFAKYDAGEERRERK